MCQKRRKFQRKPWTRTALPLAPRLHEQIHTVSVALRSSPSTLQWLAALLELLLLAILGPSHAGRVG